MNQTETQVAKKDLMDNILQILAIPKLEGNTGGDTQGAVELRNGHDMAKVRAKLKDSIIQESEQRLNEVILNIIRVQKGKDDCPLDISQFEVTINHSPMDNMLVKAQFLDYLLKDGVHPKIAFERSTLFADSEKAYNLSKPYLDVLRDVGGFQDIQSKMPFYRESYMTTEEEEQTYADYQAAENSSLANQVLRQISKKPMMLIQGAMVVPERQIWELLAPADGVPKVTVNIEGKKYVIDYTADNGTKHKTDHFIEISGETDKWTASATATPLADLIKARREFAKKTGYSLTRFSMNTETFEMILNAEDTKKQVLGITAYNGGIRVRQEDVLAYDDGGRGNRFKQFCYREQ